MALKEIYHTVASTLPTDADTGTILAGVQVRLDANALVTNITAITDVPIGVAGDTKRQGTGLNNPESANLVTGAHQTVTGGATRATQNRVADNYNETLASGEITVYHGAGEFWTDQYDTNIAAWTPGQILDYTATGLWTNTVASTYRTGVLFGAPQALPSGVPGTDVQGSISFGTFLHLRLWH